MRLLIHFIITAVLGALVLFLLLEWASGCGESYVDSKGVTHVNECLLINRGESK